MYVRVCLFAVFSFLLLFYQSINQSINQTINLFISGSKAHTET